ncbi:MAG: DUF1893 domain-containing protein [Oscillospiraceae bacterium]|nr:DUF1893 domain-containing protein [Oscillospiraceae bacterium]
MENTALNKAISLLESGGYTCVLTDGDVVFTSNQRGVKPLAQFLESGTAFTGFSAADKVVGRATAYLYALLGVKALYAQVVSQPAIAVLREHGIDVSYGKFVLNIINRKGDGICPFEAAVLEITDPQRAYAAIRQKMQELNMQ